MSKSPIRTTAKTVSTAFYHKGSAAYFEGTFKECAHSNEEFTRLGWRLIWNPQDGRAFVHPDLRLCMQLTGPQPEHKMNKTTDSFDWMSNEALIAHYKDKAWGDEAFIMSQQAIQEALKIPQVLSKVN